MTFTLKVCTLNGNCAEKEFIVVVDNRNEAPYFDTGNSRYVNKNLLRILIKVTKDDVRNDFPDPNFLYESPEVVDPNVDAISMRLEGVEAL